MMTNSTSHGNMHNMNSNETKPNGGGGHDGHNANANNGLHSMDMNMQVLCCSSTTLKE